MTAVGTITLTAMALLASQLHSNALQVASGGPSPVDRRKPGTKQTVLVDAKGTPLVMQSAAANVSDHCQILSTVVKYPAIGGKPGRPRLHPTTLYADAGYDSEGTRDILRILGITPLIRRRNEPHGS